MVRKTAGGDEDERVGYCPSGGRLKQAGATRPRSGAPASASRRRRGGKAGRHGGGARTVGEARVDREARLHAVEGGKGEGQRHVGRVSPRCRLWRGRVLAAASRLLLRAATGAAARDGRPPAVITGVEAAHVHEGRSARLCANGRDRRSAGCRAEEAARPAARVRQRLVLVAAAAAAAAMLLAAATGVRGRTAAGGRVRLLLLPLALCREHFVEHEAPPARRARRLLLLLLLPLLLL
jgi:hypothetical protein